MEWCFFTAWWEFIMSILPNGSRYLGLSPSERASWCASVFRNLNINPQHKAQLRILVMKGAVFTSEGAPSRSTALQGCAFSFFWALLSALNLWWRQSKAIKTVWLIGQTRSHFQAKETLHTKHSSWSMVSNQEHLIHAYFYFCTYAGCHILISCVYTLLSLINQCRVHSFC